MKSLIKRNKLKRTVTAFLAGLMAIGTISLNTVAGTEEATGHPQLPTYNIETLGQVEIPEGFEYYKTITYYEDGILTTTTFFKEIQTGRNARNVPSVRATTTQRFSAHIPAPRSIVYTTTIGGVLHTGTLHYGISFTHTGMPHRYRDVTFSGFVSPIGGIFSTELD